MYPSIRVYEAFTLATLFTLLVIVHAQGGIEYNGVSDQSFERDFLFNELSAQEMKAVDDLGFVENNTNVSSNTEIPILTKQQLKSENNENSETSEDSTDLIKLLSRRMRQTLSSKDANNNSQNLPRNILTKREVNDDESSVEQYEEIASKDDPFIVQKRKQEFEAKSRAIDIEKTFNDTTKSTGDMQIGIFLFKDKITDMSQNSKKLANCLSEI